MCVPRLPALESADTVAPAPTRADVWRHVGCGADRDQISQCCPPLPLYKPWQSAAHQAQTNPSIVPWKVYCGMEVPLLK